MIRVQRSGILVIRVPPKGGPYAIRVFSYAWDIELPWRSSEPAGVEFDLPCPAGPARVELLLDSRKPTRIDEAHVHVRAGCDTQVVFRRGR